MRPCADRELRATYLVKRSHPLLYLLLSRVHLFLEMLQKPVSWCSDTHPKPSGRVHWNCRP